MYMSGNGTYSVDIHFVRRNGRKATEWWIINPDGSVHQRGVDTEERAREIAAGLNAKLAAPAPVEAPAKPAPMAPGWSNAARRRSGSSRDVVSDYMADSFGLRSPTAGTNDCHYCGLDRRTCDCH